jgi:catechol 2,3-dioxygenase-like lactoylglutathione lyase family enzyme
VTPEQILAAAPLVLPQQESERYFEDGFLVVPGYVSVAWLDRLRAVVTAKIEESRGLTASDDQFDLAPDHRAEKPNIRRLRKAVDQHPNAEAVERRESAFWLGSSSHSGDRLYGHFRARYGSDASLLRGYSWLSTRTRAFARLDRISSGRQHLGIGQAKAHCSRCSNAQRQCLASTSIQGFRDQCADELVRQGVNLLSPPTDQVFGHRTLFFRDPDGNLLEIFADI